MAFYIGAFVRAMEMTMTRPIRTTEFGGTYAELWLNLCEAKGIEMPLQRELIELEKARIPKKGTPETEGEGFQGPEQSGRTDDAS